MSRYLGIDTSNYTTSAAVYDTSDNSIVQEKLLLPVKEGGCGLRQSDAVFHHTVQLPKVIAALSDKTDLKNISAVGVSFRPRNIEGSYMPCFLCGEGLADSLGKFLGVPVFKTSHQCGHILAALYSADRLSLLSRDFIAFHVSGGTTDCLFCSPDKKDVLSVTEIGSSLDLKGGQLIDRIGVMLGLKFPCGPQLENLAEKSSAEPRKMNVRPVMKDGSCCLSGFENKFQKMYSEGVPAEDIALACEYAVAATVLKMTEHALSQKGDIPLLFAGGVMSNGYIRCIITDKYKNAFFAAPEFSCDNAAGTAIFAALKFPNGEKKCL